MNNFNIDYIAASFKLKLSTLTMFAIISFFVDTEYNGGSSFRNISLECVNYDEYSSEFETNHIVFIESSDINISSVNQNYDDKHYSRTKKFRNIITEFNPYITIVTSTRSIVNPKVGLFILYSSLKLPS